MMHSRSTSDPHFPRLGLIVIASRLESEALGVGSEQEDTIADVRGADGSRGHTVPFRNPPARGQGAEDLSERGASVDVKQAGHVLDEQHRGTALLDGSPHGRPQPSGVSGSEPLACDAGALTGETGSDEIHAVAVRAAVEGFQIVPDRARIQGTLDHSIREDGSRIGLPLDRTHNANWDASQPEPEFDPSVSGTEREGT